MPQGRLGVTIRRAEENRFASLQRSRPETAQELDDLEQTYIDARWARLELMLAGQDAASSLRGP